LTDTGGGLAAAYRFSPWGTRTQTLGSVQQPFGFTGREHEGDLVYVRARYLAPGLGRWVNADPIGFVGGDVNLHRYVKNIPTRFTDPLGLLDPSGCKDYWTCVKECLDEHGFEVYALSQIGAFFIYPHVLPSGSTLYQQLIRALLGSGSYLLQPPWSTSLSPIPIGSLIILAKPASIIAGCYAGCSSRK
jgi:RHS repeat-associated protein